MASKPLKPLVYRAIKFTGKNGAEVRAFLDDLAVITRAGNGWVGVRTNDAALSEVIYKAGVWFVTNGEEQSLTTLTEEELNRLFKPHNTSKTRWVKK